MTRKIQSVTDEYGNKVIQTPNGDVYDCVGGTIIVYSPEFGTAQFHSLDSDSDGIDAAYTNLDHDGLIAVRDFINEILEAENESTRRPAPHTVTLRRSDESEIGTGDSVCEIAEKHCDDLGDAERHRRRWRSCVVMASA
jgi:hypothetical protein